MRIFIFVNVINGLVELEECPSLEAGERCANGCIDKYIQCVNNCNGDALCLNNCARDSDSCWYQCPCNEGCSNGCPCSNEESNKYCQPAVNVLIQPPTQSVSAIKWSWDGVGKEELESVDLIQNSEYSASTHSCSYHMQGRFFIAGGLKQDSRKHFELLQTTGSYKRLGMV